MSSYVGTKRASELLGCSQTHVKKLADIGTLPCAKTLDGRRVFNLEDVDAIARLKVTRERQRR